jgi:hypothetical protein
MTQTPLPATPRSVEKETIGTPAVRALGPAALTWGPNNGPKMRRAPSVIALSVAARAPVRRVAGILDQQREAVIGNIEQRHFGAMEQGLAEFRASSGER